MIRIPPDADTNLQRALEDVEDRLRRLEIALASQVPTVVDEALTEEVDLLKSKMGQLDLFRDSEGAIADVKTGNPLRVLHETGEFKEVLEGLVKAVPAELGGASKAQRVVNVLASLAVINALSAETVRARVVDAQSYNTGGSAILRSAGYDGSGGVNTDRIAWVNTWNDDSVLYTLADNDCRVTVGEAGTYLVAANGRTSGVADSALARFYIRKNESNIIYHDTGASSGGASGAALSCLIQASATEYFDFYCPDPAPVGEATARFSILKVA